jgi:hypothetical protein
VTKPQDIINLIDVGLQTPAPDPTYGEVSPINRETCARCPRPPADESEFCLGCRAYLLGDREEDPREGAAQGGWLVSEPAREMARSVSVLMTRESIEEGLQLVHLCENPCCVNPDHLEPTGTTAAREMAVLRLQALARRAMRQVVSGDALPLERARETRDRATRRTPFEANTRVYYVPSIRMTDEMHQAISDYDHHHVNVSAGVCPDHGETCLRCDDQGHT